VLQVEGLELMLLGQVLVLGQQLESTSMMRLMRQQAQV
jgi:hypothetical protein